MTDSTQLSVGSYDAIYSTEPSNGSTYAALHVAISAYLDRSDTTLLKAIKK